MLTQEIKQRTQEWFDARSGKFTASRISELMGIKGLNKTGETYCFEKAVEIVFGKDEEEDFTSFDMQRGNALEPLAFRKFKEIKELEFLDVQECGFFPHGKNAGASPDGLAGKNAILEIKCPRSNKFFGLVRNGMIAIDPGYIDQMQMQMLCTNSEKAYFFNYIIFKGQEMWHEIEVPRNEGRIEIMKERIEEAVILRDKIIIELTNNQQF
jgi:putative phage-type endonuclease